MGNYDLSIVLSNYFNTTATPVAPVQRFCTTYNSNSSTTQSMQVLFALTQPQTPSNQPDTETISADVATPTSPIITMTPSSGDTTTTATGSTRSSADNVSLMAFPSSPLGVTTRGCAGKDFPRKYTNLIVTYDPSKCAFLVVPTSHRLALSEPSWHKAMKVEFDALQQNNTWVLVPWSSSVNLVGCKRIFKLKQHPVGSINKHKAQLVARGFS